MRMRKSNLFSALEIAIAERERQEENRIYQESIFLAGLKAVLRAIERGEEIEIVE